MLPSWVVCTTHAVILRKVCDFCNWVTQKYDNFEQHLISKSRAACPCVYVRDTGNLVRNLCHLVAMFIQSS